MRCAKGILLCLFFLFSCIIIGYSQKSSVWNTDKELQHLKNREDSTTWDKEMLAKDLDRVKVTGIDIPVNIGAFPVPEYKLLGENMFKGVGLAGNMVEGIRLEDKRLLYAHFSANKNAITEPYIGEQPNEVFFTIVVLTDFIDTINYTHAKPHIISRNNPDYIGQGFFKTQNDRIDYLAFLTADRNEYAIVNMRLFNLKHGRTVLIAPQKNGTIRSMQIKSPLLSREEIDEYLKSLVEETKVKAFFLSPGNI